VNVNEKQKLYLPVSALIIVLVLVSCSKHNGDFLKFFAKEGIQPYILSESEKDLLISFDIEEKIHKLYILMHLKKLLQWI